MLTKKILTAVGICTFLLSCNNDRSSVSDTITTEQILAKTNIYPVTPEKWMGENHPYYTSGYVGDVMPYYENGKFHLYFLHDAKSKPVGEGFHDIHSFETTDFVNFQYNGREIPYGKTGEADFGVGTGSLVKYNNVYYYYYSGHNENAAFMQNNPRESVLLATSTDLKTWTKIPSFKITAPIGYYDYEFRDPHVFYNTDDGKYWMLISAQTSDRKAVILKMTTTNPQTGKWVAEGNLYTSSENYIMLECSDMFKIGNYWYLFFSESWSSTPGTHYRVSTSANGPWTTPENDRLDGSYLYAAKTAADGTNRYLFGWAARKSPENNTGSKEWAGNLITHQIIQNSDGTLSVKQPDNVAAVFSESATLSAEKTTGTVSQKGTNFTLGTDALATFSKLKMANLISFDLKYFSTGQTGVILAHDTDNQNGIRIALEPENSRLAAYTISGGTEQLVNTHTVNLSAQQSHSVKIAISNDICVVYVDNKIAFTNRVYSVNGSRWSIFAKNQAVFSNMTIKNPK